MQRVRVNFAVHCYSLYSQLLGGADHAACNFPPEDRSGKLGEKKYWRATGLQSVSCQSEVFVRMSMYLNDTKPTSHRKRRPRTLNCSCKSSPWNSRLYQHSRLVHHGSDHRSPRLQYPRIFRATAHVCSQQCPWNGMNMGGRA